MPQTAHKSGAPLTLSRWKLNRQASKHQRALGKVARHVLLMQGEAADDLRVLQEQTKACGIEFLDPIGAWLLVHVELTVGARQGVGHKQEIARRQRGDEIVDVLRGDVLHYLNAGDQIDRRTLIRLVGKIVEDQRVHGMLHVVRHALKADDRDVMLVMNVIRQMATSGADIEDTSHAEAA